MRLLAAWSLKFRFLIVALAAAMIVIGISQLRDMPVDMLPEFAPPYIQVQTEAPGLSEIEVEQLITFSLEGLLSGTPWLQSIHSTSIPGLSSITLVFQPGTDILRARQLVSERLSLAYTLPNVAQSPIILQPLSVTSRVMMIGLTSKKVSLIDMSILAHWNIRPALLSIPGVANIAIWGMRDKQLQVLVDPKNLQANHVTLDQIISTTGNTFWISPLSFLNASTPGSGGWIETPQQRIEIQHTLPISTPGDLAQVNIENTALQLGKVASVIEGHPPLIGDDIVDDGSGLMIVVDKFPGANPLEITREAEAKLAALQPGLTGIQIDTTIFRPASFVETTLYTTSLSLLTGFFLLIIVLFVLFYDWRTVLISLMAIITSFTLALLMLNLAGATMNTMVLAGLVMAIAIVVDEAIIEVVNMMQHQRLQKNMTIADIILGASFETRNAMTYSILISLLTLLPIYFLPGVTGIFFKPLVLSYALALLSSLLVALTVTPALYIILLPKTSFHSREPHLLHWLRRGYHTTLEWMIQTLSPLWLAVSIVCTAILSLTALMFMTLSEESLIPTFKEPNIMVQWEGPPGTSTTEMTRITTRVIRELQSIPGVLNVAAVIGRAVLGDQLVNVNSAELVVSVDPGANYDQITESIKNVVHAYPGIYHVVQSYLNEKIRQVLTGSNSDIVVRLFGPSLAVLRDKANEVVRVIAKIHGATEIHIEQEIKQPQITIKVDLAKAQQYGLKPGDVRRAVSTYIAGIEVGSLFLDQKVFQVEVWGTPETRNSLNSIRNLLIDTPRGKQVRLADIAAVDIAPTQNLIQHEAISRRIDISLNISGNDKSVIVNDIKQSLKEIQFPLEYHAELLNAYQEQHISTYFMFSIWVTAALCVLLFLQAAFSSWRLAFALFLILPSALIGCVLTAFIIDSSTFASLVGLLAVYGLTIRNSIMLIKHYQNLLRHEPVSFNQSLILRGAKERLASILIAMTATLLVLSPFTLFNDTPGLEVGSEIATIIFGGLLTSLIFNLFIVPFLYMWLDVNTPDEAV